MFARTCAPEAEAGASSAAEEVSDNLAALRQDIAGLAQSVTRLASTTVAEAPELARESFEAAIRRNPLQSTLIAAGAGFVLALIVTR